MEAARDGAFVGGLAQAGGFGGLRGRHELSWVGAAVRGELIQRDPLGGGVARARQLCAAADGRRYAFTARRGARGFSAWPSSARSRPYAQRNLRPSVAWRGEKGVAIDDVAIFGPPRHHVQKKSAHASEQDRPDVLERRRRWFDGQLDLDPLKLVFVDETAATTNMARRYGRRRRGQRLRCGVPHGHDEAITFVFGLRREASSHPRPTTTP